MWKRYSPVYTILVLSCVLGTSIAAFADAVPRMSVDELKSRLGAEDIVVLDVRSDRDWTAANTMIAGAVRVNPAEINQWAEGFSGGKTIVLYCA